MALSPQEARTQADKQLSEQERKDADAWESWDDSKGAPPKRLEDAYSKRATLTRNIIETAQPDGGAQPKQPMANGDLSDLSGWTFKEVGSGGAPVQQQSAPQADITKHDPQTYAGLTTDAAIADLHSRGLMPDIGTARDIYTKAMEESQQHWQHEAEAAQAKRLELQTRVAAVTPGKTETGATA